MNAPTPRNDYRRLFPALLIVGGIAALLPPPASWIIAAALLVGAVTLTEFWTRPPFAPLIPHIQPHTLLGLGAFGLMIAAAYEFRPDNPSIGLAVGLALAGGVLVRLAARSLPLARAEAAPLTPVRAHLPLTAAGIALLALTAEASGRALGIAPLYGLSVHVQQGMLWAGLALLVVGLSGGRLAFGNWRLANSQQPTANGLFLLIIFLLALRVIGLDTTIRTSVDEALWTDGVRFLTIAPDVELLRMATSHFPTTLVYTHWTYMAVELFGRTLTGLRLTNAVLGALNVLAVYGLARALFDRRIALIAALILATFPPHLHFSRVSMPQMSDALFGTAALLFAARGWRWNRRLDWALAGVALGLTQYFYEGGRLLFPPLLLAWSGIVILSPRLPTPNPTPQPSPRIQGGGEKRATAFSPSPCERSSPGRGGWGVGATLLPGLGVMWLAAILVAVPVYYAMIAGARPFLNRLEGSGVTGAELLALVSAGDIGGLLRQFLSPLLVYVHQPEAFADFYGGSQPMILTIFVPLLLIGVFAVLRRHPAIILPLWALAAALGNGLLREHTLYNRYILAFPALALMMAVGIVWIFQLFTAENAEERREAQSHVGTTPALSTSTDEAVLVPTKSLSLRSSAFSAVSVFACLIAIIQTAYYFGPHLAQFNAQLRDLKPYRDGVEAVLRAAEFPPGTRLVIIDRPKNDALVLQNWLDYVAPGQMQIRVLDSAEVDDALLASWPHDAPYAFFLPPGDAATLARVRRHFALQPPGYSPYNIPARHAYVLYFAQPG